MKNNKKNKPSLNLDNIKNKKLPKKGTNITKQHTKLLQYRDYLLSLRKMDLGSLIKKRQKNKVLQNSTQQIQPHTTEKQRKVGNPQEYKENNIQQEISRKTQFNLRNQIISDYLNRDIFNNINYGSQRKTKNVKQNFTFKTPLNIADEDLYCHEDMDDLMNNKKCNTPRLIHINNFNGYRQRQVSTYRSSRDKQFSMPSIQQRNVSQESQDSLKNSSRKNHRKFHSFTHTQNIKNPQNEWDTQPNTKRIFHNSFKVQSARQKGKQNQQENLCSTGDTKKYCSNKFQQKFNKKVLVQPFKLNQTQKIELNVCEIVKKINRNSNRSSMSDKNYKKKNKNTINCGQMNSGMKQLNFDFKNSFSDLRKILKPKLQK